MKSILQHQATTKLWVLLGHLLFLGLLALSLVYYKERMLAMDTAYYSFRMIIEDGFYTGHERYISFLPQLLPVLILKFGGSLQLFLISYSAGFILFYYAAYNIIVYLFRNPAAGVFLALAMCLTIRYKFYGPVGESVLSITYLALLLGWLSKPKEHFTHLSGWLDVIIGCFIGSLMYTAHPIIMMATFLSLGFLMFFQKEWRNVRFWIVSVFTGFVLYYRFIFTSRGSYEQARADRLNETLEILTNYQEYYTYEIIMKYFETQYLLPFVVFLLSLVLLARHKHWWLSVYVFLSFLFVLAFVFVLHAYLESDIFIMIDGYLTYLGVIWALPLAFLFVKCNQSWMVITIGVLLVFSLYKIESSSEFFTERLAYLQTAIDEHTSAEEPKAVAYLTEMNYEKLWIGWALSCETLMLSSLEGPHDSRSIYLANKPGDLEGRLDEEGSFWNVHFGQDYIKLKDLPKRFFDLSDAPYREVKLD